MKYFVLFILSCILLKSCQSDLNPIDYVNYLDSKENGLIKIWDQGEKKLTCQYLPAHYLILKQSDYSNISREDFLGEVKHAEEMIHFKLKFEKNNSNNFLKDRYTSTDEFNTMSMYLSYDIRYDFKVVIDDDTSYCALSHHERTYGNTPYETVLASFPLKSESNLLASDVEFIFDDRVFGFGKVKFFYPKSLLQSLPHLNLSSINL